MSGRSGHAARQIRELVRAAERQGCTVRVTTSNHYRVTGPNGVTVTTSRSPSDANAPRNVRRDFRKYLNVDV